MKLFVVIINYRVAQLTIDCLHSVAAEIDSVPNTRVAVCENGTGDDSAERIQRAIDENNWGSWCNLTALPVNVGFTGGNNAVIRPILGSEQTPEYVFLLNPDTIVRPNAFKAMIDFMDAYPKVGIAGSRLEEPDGTPQRSAFRFQSPLGEFEANLKLGVVSRLLHRWIVAPPVVDHSFQTDWVSGAGMIIRRPVFEDVGLLDEGLFTYFDDCDICLNAKRAGWPTWYVPGSRVVHLVGQSTGIDGTPRRLPSYVLDARRRYFLKNFGPLYSAVVDACAITGLSLGRLKVLLTRKADSTPPYLLRDSIRHSVFAKGFQVPIVQSTASKPDNPS
jgi:N-acetylglucosaminyl-diphospho-decaprenol L-rhamnosyltransferase